MSEGFYFDANSLYPSVLCLELPSHDYLLLNEYNHKAEFQMITNKILDGDTKYFADIAASEKKSFLVECTLVFDKSSAKANSLDLPGLPTVRQIHNEEIGNFQFFEQKRTKTTFDKMPPKLVSDLSDGIHTEFIDTIFFLELMFGAEVTKVHRIVSFKTNAYMRDYCLRLCKLRSETKSTILNKIIKTYTNAIPGDTNNTISITICSFLVAFTNFYQLLAISSYYQLLPTFNDFFKLLTSFSDF